MATSFYEAPVLEGQPVRDIEATVAAVEDYNRIGRVHALDTCLHDMQYGREGEDKTDMQIVFAGADNFFQNDSSKVTKQDRLQAREFIVRELTTARNLFDENPGALVDEQAYRYLVYSCPDGDAEAIAHHTDLIEEADNATASTKQIDTDRAIMSYLFYWARPADRRFTMSVVDDPLRDSINDELRSGETTNQERVRALTTLHKMSMSYGMVD